MRGRPAYWRRYDDDRREPDIVVAKISKISIAEDAKGFVEKFDVGTNEQVASSGGKFDLELLRLARSFLPDLVPMAKPVTVVVDGVSYIFLPTGKPTEHGKDARPNPVEVEFTHAIARSQRALRLLCPLAGDPIAPGKEGVFSCRLFADGALVNVYAPPNLLERGLELDLPGRCSFAPGEGPGELAPASAGEDYRYDDVVKVHVRNGTGRIVSSHSILGIIGRSW